MAGGFRLGRYELREKLATGGMAEIWLATQRGPAGFEKQLVVKKILPHLAADRAFVDMFLNEGRYAAMINHPNVVQVFELGEEAGSYYLVMEHVPGLSLRVLLNRLKAANRPAPIGCVAHLFVGVCRGLHAAHELVDAAGQPLGLVHRDVSPENVLVSRSGEAKVTDFGIAKAAASASTTRPGEARGKLAYMPPEQLLGEPLDRRTDIYAVGATLFECTCGERPFVVPADAALSVKILEMTAPLLSTVRDDVPQLLEAAVARALDKRVDARWPDALALARELEPLASTANVVADWLAEFLPAPEPTSPSRAHPATAPLAAGPAPDAVATLPETDLPKPRRRWASVVALAGAVGLTGAFVASRLDPSATLSASLEPRADSGLAPSAPLPPSPAPVVPAAVDAGSPEPRADAGHPDEKVVATRKPKVGKGRLLIRVSPWADVLVDGNMVGATPLPALEVTSGRHQVTVTNSELGQTRTVNVDVRAGRQELVQFNLKP